MVLLFSVMLFDVGFTLHDVNLPYLLYLNARSPGILPPWALHPHTPLRACLPSVALALFFSLTYFFSLIQDVELFVLILNPEILERSFYHLFCVRVHVPACVVSVFWVSAYFVSFCVSVYSFFPAF